MAAERQAARAEATALAPWRQAIAVARAAKRTARAARRAELAAKRTARQAERTASAAKRTARPATRTTPVPAAPATRLPALDQLPDQRSLLERELAARKAGLRVRISEPGRPKATVAPKPASTFSRIYPVNPETAAAAPKPGSTFSRIHPMNPETTAAAPKPNSAFSRIYRKNPETTARSQPKRLTPTKAEVLRSTTLANIWDPTLRATLEKRFGPAPPPTGWFVPQAWPPPPNLEIASNSTDDKSPSHRHAKQATSLPRPRPDEWQPSRRPAFGAGVGRKAAQAQQRRTRRFQRSPSTFLRATRWLRDLHTPSTLRPQNALRTSAHLSAPPHPT